MKHFVSAVVCLHVLCIPSSSGTVVAQERWSRQWEESIESSLPSDRIMDAIGIKEGMSVAEIGAGNGRFAVRLAKRVGDSGMVYANDIDREALEFMRTRGRDERIRNMIVVEGGEADPRLPRGAMDAVILINTLHMVKEPVPLLKNTIPALKPGGVLAIIDFDKAKLVNRKEPKAEALLPREHCIRLLVDSGFEVFKELTFLPRHYFVLLRVGRTVDGVSGQTGTPVLRRIADRLYDATGAGARVMALVTDRGILVVDSGNSPEAGARIVEAVRGISDAPIRYLVYTHYHGDHCGGGASFPSSTVVMAHSKTRQNVGMEIKFMAPSVIRDLERKATDLKATRNPGWKAVQQEVDKTRRVLKEALEQPYTLPQVTFESRVTVRVGDDEAHLLYLGPAHTNGDVVVHFPRQRVVHIGDLLFTNGWVPRLDGDAGSSVDDWLRILDAVAAMDVDQIVPGHGDIVDKVAFVKIAAAQKRYLTDLKAEVWRLVRQGFSLEEIKSVLRLPRYANMGMADMLLPWNIEGAYREILQQGTPARRPPAVSQPSQSMQRPVR